MPPLTKEQLDQVKYVSVEDYCTRVDQLESLDDKLAFTTRYILTHGEAAGEPDHPIDHIIQVAHMKIADKSADLKSFYRETDVNRGRVNQMVDPNVEAYEDDLGSQMFIANPVGYLKGHAQELDREIHQKQWMSQEDTSFLVNLGRLRNDVFTDQFAGKMAEAIKKPTAFDVNHRLETIFGGPRAFQKALDDTKPGVLSRMFGTRSVASANLEQAWKAFSNPNHALHGNLPTIKTAATQYLQHALPNWKPERPSELPSEADIARLSGTKKARALLSLNILKAAKEQEAMEDGYQEMVESTQAKNIAFHDIPGHQQSEVAQENVNSFQSQVQNDLIQEEGENNLVEESQNEVSNEIDINAKIEFD